MNKPKHKVILFYKFFKVRNPAKFRDEQKKLLNTLNINGRMLIASEGVNATFEGTESAINKYIRALKSKKAFKDLVVKQSKSNGRAFTRLEVKVRDEVVTLGVGDLNIKKDTAKTITASELERMYKKGEDFVVLDLRTNFEINVGQFENTVNPGLSNFRDLPSKIKELEPLKTKKVVAVCTGGIRCEKGTCLLKQEGFKNIYQLKDGIHTYMQKYPNRHFKGSLFVFDNRMTTPVVTRPGRQIIGKCIYCAKKCESFYSNDTVRPSIKIICCNACAKKHTNELRKCVA